MRLIIPVYYEGVLVNWTARAIGPSTVKYLSLPHEESRAKETGRPQAVLPIKDMLFLYDELYNAPARILVITEGPMDALKIDWLGVDYAIRATSLFGLNVSDNQVALLSQLAPLFDEVWVVLDSTAVGAGLALMQKLAFLSPKQVALPEGVADPGEFAVDSFAEWLR